MSDPFVAEIRMFAGNFAPRGWAFCNGQLLSITQNTALFSLLGTTYGGDGQSTFALPDLQGRVPLQPGQGPGLRNRLLGEVGGLETVTLTAANLPNHNHQAFASTGAANTATAQGGLLASTTADNPIYAAPGTGTPLTMGPSAVGSNDALPHNNMQPFITMTFIIALQGIFPPRG
jgi:microcystin-dependent protein